MALTYTINGGSLGQPNILVIGDGTSTSIDIDLTIPPFNFDYKGNKPIIISNVQFSLGSGEVALDTSRTSVTITFDTPLANNQRSSITFALGFNGI